jgi:CBS domain containing-hemolysin-like protein
VVLGEQAPKIIALQGPETWALWIAWPMRLANGLLWPLVWFLNHSTQLVVKAFGLKPVAAHARAHSEEELGMILDESRKAGVVSRDEHRMLERVFRFHDKTVKEIMAPRPDIVAVNLRANEKELLRLFLESGYSRLPVYDGSLDKIAGLVFVKDLLYALEHPELIKLVDLLREVDLVPETYPLPNLLKDFQKHHKHLAMVVDEYGATAGLVTLEDVVEEIVGEIRDEHDVEPEEIQRLPDGTLLVECRLSLDRFREVFPGLPLPRGDFDTVGGLVLQLAGKLPKEGDSFRVGELAIRVVKREGRRLRRVAVRRIPPGQTQSVPVFGGELPSGVMPFSETLETRAPGDERPSGARPADPGKRK